MKLRPINYIDENIYVSNSKGMGRGMFTWTSLEKGTVIEVAPVIVMSRQERTFLDQTLLHDYIFEWGERQDQCCVAMGYVSIYNHSYQSNCEYEMNFTKEIISVKTIRSIEAGEELFINYNGDWNNAKPLWFDAK